MRDFEFVGKLLNSSFVDIASSDNFAIGDGQPAGLEVRPADDAAGANQAHFEGFIHRGKTYLRIARRERKSGLYG